MKGQNMPPIRRPLLATLFVALALSLATAAFASTSNPSSSWYNAALSGDNEIPAVETDASGSVQFKLDKEAQTLEFRMQVRRLDGLTQAHVHFGSRRENGPVAAFLVDPIEPPAGPQQGTIARGVITADDLVGQFAGEWDRFVSALRTGRLYVNVHTADYPGGEIRGQIRENSSMSRPVSPPVSPPISPPISPPHGR